MWVKRGASCCCFLCSFDYSGEKKLDLVLVRRDENGQPTFIFQNADNPRTSRKSRHNNNVEAEAEADEDLLHENLDPTTSTWLIARTQRWSRELVTQDLELLRQEEIKRLTKGVARIERKIQTYISQNTNYQWDKVRPDNLAGTTPSAVHEDDDDEEEEVEVNLAELGSSSAAVAAAAAAAAASGIGTSRQDETETNLMQPSSSSATTLAASSTRNIHHNRSSREDENEDDEDEEDEREADDYDMYI